MSKTVTTIVTEEYLNILKDVDSGAGQIFITGNAGTGKSTFLNYLLLKKNCIKVAPTGVAATNIKGMTIHSFFKINPSEANVFKSRALPKKQADLLMKADAIVIDEISMVSALLLDQINVTCQKTLGNKKAFGGRQIIMFGDIGQLQPVVNKSLGKMLEKQYDSQMFFDSFVFKNLCKDVKYHCLTKNFRQQDEKFSKVLDAVRTGTLSPRQLDILNTRVINDDTTTDGAVYLASTNEVVNFLNDSMLKDIAETEYYFKALVTGSFKSTNTILIEDLRLKKGCKVMILVNDPKGNYINGTVGLFEGYNEEDHKILVSTADGEVYKLGLITQEDIKYDLDDNGDIVSRVTGTFRQFPVKIGYAVTIHKSQGMTFDKIVILNDKGFFGEGQGYVALSRCRTLEGISLEVPLKARDFKVNKYGIEWLTEKLNK